MPPTDPPHLEHLTEDERKMRVYLNAMPRWGPSQIFLDALLSQPESPLRPVDRCARKLEVHLRTIAALRASERDLTERVTGLERAAETFRDSVLNGRHQLEEPCLDSDQTNAVLGLFDDTIAAALAAQAKETK